MNVANRLGRTDRWLVFTLVPLWLVFLGSNLYGVAVAEARFVPAFVESARGPDSFITVLRPWGTDRLERGDRLLRIGDRDLRGWAAMPYIAFTADHVEESGQVTLVVERGGEELTVRVPTVVDTDWWVNIPFTTSLSLCALLLLVRARSWHLRRRFFAASLLFGIAFTTQDTGLPLVDVVGGVLGIFAIAAASALTVWNAFEFMEPRPLARWQRWSGTGIGVSTLVFSFVVGWLPVPVPLQITWPALNATALVFLVLVVAAVTAQYRRGDALQRRKARWAVLGVYVAVLPTAVWMMGGIIDVGYTGYLILRAVSRIALVALPVGILVSVIWYDFLDVDRVISATATWTILAFILGGVGLIAIPSLGELVAERTGIGPAGASVALCIALAAIFVPAQRALRPRFDRALFRAQHERERTIGALLESLERADGIGELARLTGEQLERAYQPESLTLYALEGEQFTPVVAGAGLAPPAFPSHGALAVTLAEGRARVLATRGARGDSGALDPFDAAALQTLDAAVVLPIRRDDDLLAFLCLGPKRSGDIYTPTDLALLMAVATRISDQLRHLDADQILREARDLQRNLRRYVPEPLAEALSEGRAIESGEREVSVLFVDIRGYSGFSESRESTEIFTTVNRYSAAVSRIATDRGGVVVEFSGDGLMVVFGALRDAPEKERAAVASAREIVEAMARLPLADERLEVGIGIATGPAFVGEIESSDRTFWSAIGNTTNLAARLQALTRELDASIAIDAVTRERAAPLCADYVAHRGVPIRGRSEREDVFILPLADG